jgi:CHAT domain
MTYIDFYLEVRASSGTTCRVTVRSPRGDCDHEIGLPVDLAALPGVRAGLHGEALRGASATQARTGAATRREAVVEGPATPDAFAFGRALYKAIFQGQVAELFAANREHARHLGKGLRVNLVTPDAALALIPWELLCPRHGDHLCLSEDTPLVRYVLVGKPRAPMQVEPPLQILGILSAGGGAPLDLGLERARISEELDPLLQRGLAEVTWLEDPTSQDLLEALDSRAWHIVHFAGHGTFDKRSSQGVLSIASEGGGQGHLRATDLRVLLRDRHSIKMVFLNSCDGAMGDARELFSSTAALVADAGVPAVLAMQFPISDRSATKFARQVYRQIAAGDSLEEAVTEARKGIFVGGSLEWATPVLFMRSTEGPFLRVEYARPSPLATRIAGASLPPIRVAGAGLTAPSPRAPDAAPDDETTRVQYRPPPVWRRVRVQHTFSLLVTMAFGSPAVTYVAAKWFAKPAHASLETVTPASGSARAPPPADAPAGGLASAPTIEDDSAPGATNEGPGASASASSPDQRPPPAGGQGKAAPSTTTKVPPHARPKTKVCTTEGDCVWP